MVKYAALLLIVLSFNANANGPMGMGYPGMGMPGMGFPVGMPGMGGYGMPGVGIGPPPRINPQNYNLPPPWYQTIWDGNCMCYRPFQPNHAPY